MNTSTTILVRTRASRRQARGLTLVELMIVVAIVAVLAGSGAPALTATIKSIQLSMASNDLLWSLFMARSEAIKRKTRVAVCKSADGVACNRDGGWHQGWLVFHDTDNDGERGGGEAVIQRYPALGAGLRVTGNLSVARYVSYSPTGTTRLVGGGFQAGTITLCRQSVEAADARQIIVSSSGRPRVQKARLAECA